MKIAVVGAGIFGCVVALDLKEHISSDVTLFERHDDILSEASKVNQFRLHRGYHYPRSVETALQSKQGFESFKQRFSECVTDYGIPHYYGLAKGSITDSTYINFMNTIGIEYEQVSVESSIFNPKNVESAFIVNEQSLKYYALKQRLTNDLVEYVVKVKLNTKFEPTNLDEFDLVINCTYANINYLLPEEQRIEYQFELVEKFTVGVMGRYSGVVIDGDYMCLDPTETYNEHQIGHVKYAVHKRQIGHFLDWNNDWINRYKQPTRHKNLILEDFYKYFNIQINSVIGSNLVVRTVLPNREHDDARPSYITKHSNKLYSIFSGKIGTVVDISNELIKLIKDHK